MFAATPTSPLSRELLYGVLDEKYTDFANANLSMMRGHDKDVLFSVSNRGSTLKILRNEFHKEFRYKLNLTEQTAFPCLFNFLFRMNHEACEGNCRAVRRRLRKSNRDPKSFSIGLQIRYENTSFTYCSWFR